MENLIEEYAGLIVAVIMTFVINGLFLKIFNYLDTNQKNYLNLLDQIYLRNNY